MQIPILSKVPELNISKSFMYEWKRLPNKLEVDDNQTHIWKVDLNAERLHDDCRRILSVDEQLRAERMIITEKRKRFQSARSALREILSIYLNQPPESIQFKYKPNGKPYLFQISQPNSIEFNIAHSENLMVAAFTKCVPVGIDLEINQSVSSMDWIVKRYYSKDDQIIFRKIPEKDKKSAFLTAWTKKEAYGKAVGNGLASPPKMNHFIPGLHRALPNGHCEIVSDGSFWFLRFTPEENFIAAIAIKSLDKPEPYFWMFSKIP